MVGTPTPFWPVGICLPARVRPAWVWCQKAVKEGSWGGSAAAGESGGDPCPGFSLPCLAPPHFLPRPPNPHPSPPTNPLPPSSPISARCNVSPLLLLTRWSSLAFSSYGLALQLRTSDNPHQPSCPNIILIIKRFTVGRLELIRCILQTMFSHHAELVFPFPAAVTVCSPLTSNHPSSPPFFFILAYFS